MAHPDFTDKENYNIAYWQLQPLWIDLLNMKEPLPGTLSKFLNRYAKEDNAEFRERVKRLAQVNFLDLIIDSYVSMIFSTNINITSEAYQDQVQQFANCCNYQGDSLKDYFAEIIAPSAFLYGITDVFVDKPSVAEDQVVETVQQQRDAGLDRPYCYIVPPLNRPCWALDDAGNYVKYQTYDWLDTRVQPQMQIKDKTQYTIWTTDNVTVCDNSGGVIDTKPNPYGLIPAVTVTSRYAMRFHKDRLGISLVQDVLDIQKLVLNLISLIFDFHENANYAYRVIIQDTDNGENPPSEGELAEGGNRRGAVLRGKGSKMDLLEPDAAGVDSMRMFLSEMINRAYQSVLMSTEIAESKSHTSLPSIRASNTQLYSRLTKITKHFSRAMKQIIDMSLTVQGLDPAKAKVKVEWDTSYAADSFTTSLEQLSLLRETMLDICPPAVMEFAKKAIGPELYDSPKIADIFQALDDYKAPEPQAPQPGQAGDPAVKPNLQAENTQFNAADKIDEQ